MMTKLLVAVALSLSLAFSGAWRVMAQTSTPPVQHTGTITGQITNGTALAAVPNNQAVMLHAWEGDTETVMLDGTADESGAFRFVDVPMQDGWTFGAMVSRGDVTFFSETGEVKPDTQTLDLPLTIYETSPDASAIRVAQLHALLEFASGEVQVSEIYVLSNSSDHAIVGGLTLPDGQQATLPFTLPAGANKVSFKANSERFVLTSDGFADTGAVLPGEGTGQAIVVYSLPYTKSGMTLSHAIQQPVDSVNVLLRADSGVTAVGLGDPVFREMGPEDAFNIYSIGPLSPGDSLAVKLAGEPVYSSENGTSETPATGLNGLVDRWAIPIGGGLVGVVLIGLGVWWWRRDSGSTDEPDREAEWSSIVHAIAELDEAHERGDVPESDYQTRRAELRTTAKAILEAQKADEA